MGYTHHWYRPIELAPEAWERFIEDCRKILDSCAVRGIVLAGPEGETGTLPRFDTNEVVFNGSGRQSCETFHLPRVLDDPTRLNADGQIHDFCKTQRRPYDLAVTACLLAAKHRFGENLSVVSDGKDAEWLPAKQLCQELVGYGMAYGFDAARRLVLVESHLAASRSARPDPVVIREFPTIASKYRVRVVRSSSAAAVILDIREFAQGPNFSGYTRRGIRIATLADVRLLREALQAIETDQLMR